MLVRIEPSGVIERKGLVQIRFCFYLEPGDARYDEHHIQMPIIPPEGYPGDVDDMGRPLDIVAYKAWREGLPKKWQNNPFHNHFVLVEHNIPDGRIRKLMRDFLKEFYEMWSKGDKVTCHRELVGWGDMSSENIGKCKEKVLDIKNRALAFEHKGIG